MNKVILVRSNSFEKDSTYEINREYSDSGLKKSRESLVRPADMNLVDGHYLIEQYHHLGGGSGGWESWDEFVGIAHNKEELSSKIYECALHAAKSLANSLKAEFVNQTLEKEGRTTTKS